MAKLTKTYPKEDYVLNGHGVRTRCCACHEIPKVEGLRFPKNPELKAKWINAIELHTPEYPDRDKVLKMLGLTLCTKHFDPIMLIKKEFKGQVFYALRKGGVPCKFEVTSDAQNMDVDSTTNGDDEDILICYESTCESKPQITQTEAPDVVEVDAAEEEASTADANSTNQSPDNTERGKESTVSDLMDTDEALNSDPIISLEEFVSFLKQKSDKFYEPWNILYKESSVLFTLFDNDCKYLVQSFTVDTNLKVLVFFHGQPFTSVKLIELLGNELKLDTWTKFKKLILLLHNATQQKENYLMQVKHACKLIKESIEKEGKSYFTEKQINKWKFSLNQIEIANGEDPTYSNENLKWAINAYNVNRQGYTRIYESEVLTLPHPASLELYKRQLDLMRRQQFRAKFIGKRVLSPNRSTENGQGSSGQVVTGHGIVNPKIELIQQTSPRIITSKVTNLVTPPKSGLNGLAAKTTVEEIEIQEL